MSGMRLNQDWCLLKEPVLQSLLDWLQISGEFRLHRSGCCEGLLSLDTVLRDFRTPIDGAEQRRLLRPRGDNSNQRYELDVLSARGSVDERQHI